MLRRRALLLSFTLLAPALAQEQLPGGAEAFERRLIDLAERSRERTVLIYGLIGLGSGAVVDVQGTIVTNAHVVAAARYAVVQWADGTTTLVKSRGIDYGRDLAVLEPVEKLSRPARCFELAAARPGKGAWVVAVGFPGGPRGNFDATVNVGRVTGENPSAGQGPIAAPLDYSGALRTDVPIFSGNSGGPLVDLEGRLVGINGAVDVEGAASLTIPIETVRERLEKLRGDLVVLPGDREISPAEGAILGRLYDALDPIARQLPERVAEASRRALQQELDLPGLRELPRLAERLPGAGPPSDRLATLARQGPRQAPFDAALERAPELAIALAGGGHATRVGPNHLVAKASLVGAGDEVKLAMGAVVRRVAASEADDLVLLAIPADPAFARTLPPDAPHRPVGSLVYALGPQGSLAAGVVSAQERGIGATLAASVQSGGGNAAVERLIEGAASLAKRLGIEALQQALDTMIKQMELRRGFSAGTPPRSYGGVLSIDAPVPPSAIGAPVVDRQGRLVGVAIGIAHHGTTYVVPLHRIRRVFAAHLPGPVVPAEWGRARLY